MNKVEKRYQEEIGEFGLKLKEFRELKGWTQLDLEVACGMNRTEISKIENGLKNIEFFTIVKLAVALDINVSDFFSSK